MIFSYRKVIGCELVVWIIFFGVEKSYMMIFLIQEINNNKLIIQINHQW